MGVFISYGNRILWFVLLIKVANGPWLRIWFGGCGLTKLRALNEPVAASISLHLFPSLLFLTHESYFEETPPFFTLSWMNFRHFSFFRNCLISMKKCVLVVFVSNFHAVLLKLGQLAIGASCVGIYVWVSSHSSCYWPTELHRNFVILNLRINNLIFAMLPYIHFVYLFFWYIVDNTPRLLAHLILRL